MVRPTAPTWDSNGTNTVALVAGHKTDGWATDEVPTSAEMNTYMMLVSQWLADLGATGGTAWFGDGTDGAAHFDGTTTILGLVPSSMIYTLTRDLNCTDLTIDNGVTIITAGYVICASGTLTNNGTIKWDGNAAVGNTPGAALSTSGILLGGTAGAVGGANAGTANPGYPGVSATAAAGGAGVGASGTTCAGGAGGGSSGGSGGNGGAITAMAAAKGAARLATAISGRAADGTQWYPASGGGGGEGGFAGGGGAGTVVVAANTITGSGAIHANGGAGANGTSTNGGGGGGGGGIVIVAYNTGANTQTITASGGTAGTGGGSGGASGGPGGAGKVIKYNFWNDGT